MNTPSHFLIQLGLRKFFKNDKTFRISRSYLLGAVAPDASMYLFVMICLPIFMFIQGLSFTESFRYMFGDLFFNNFFWIFGYNFLHSPTMLLILFMSIYVFKSFISKYVYALKWFIAGCFTHTFIDIFTHHGDGPRIFYPFSHYTFYSPFSYWDIQHGAKYIIPLEIGLNILVLIYIFYPYFRNRFLGKKL